MICDGAPSNVFQSYLVSCMADFHATASDALEDWDKDNKSICRGIRASRDSFSSSAYMSFKQFSNAFLCSHLSGYINIEGLM